MKKTLLTFAIFTILSVGVSRAQESVYTTQIFGSDLNTFPYGFTGFSPSTPNSQGIYGTLLGLRFYGGGSNGDWRTQLAFGTNNTMYYRQSTNTNGTVWTDWLKIYNSGNLNNATTDFTAKSLFVTNQIGIGVTTIGSALHIGANNNDGILIGKYKDRLGWDGTGAQPGYHIRFAGYRDVAEGFTGARISALRTNACCSALAQGMELAFYTSESVIQGSTGDVNLKEALRIKTNGNVGIGTVNPDAKLTVNGTIHATEIKVDIAVPADYVFDPSYKLMPLSEVEKFVKEEKHLPEIPSAAEIKENGSNVGEMQNLLLQKIEELTLYTIELNKKIEALEKKNQGN